MGLRAFALNQRGIVSAGLLVGLALLLALAAGCNSIEGRYVDPQRVAHGESVGGAPIVIERPRWLKVVHTAVSTTTFGFSSTVSETDGLTTTVREAKQIGTSVENRIESELVPFAEVYALDFRRPLAGTADNSIEYADASGHPKKLASKVDDQTLKTVVENLSGIKDFLGISGTDDRSSAAPSESHFNVEAKTIVRVELYDLFDLAAGRYRPVKVFVPDGSFCDPPCEPRCWTAAR